MRALTPAERIDGLIARGVELYLDDKGQLRAGCEPQFAHILDAARPTISMHRAAIVAVLAARAARRAA